MFVAQKVEALAYDGTNGQYIADEWLDDVAVSSDDGETLVLEIPVWPGHDLKAVPKGHVLLRSYGKVLTQVLSGPDFAQNWYLLPDPTPVVEGA